MQQISSLPGVPAAWAPTVKWLFVLGEPGISIPGVAGGLITWIKVVGLFALLAWLLSWVIASYRTRIKVQADWLDIAAGVALLGCVGSVVLNVLQSTGRLKPATISGVSLSTLILLACGAVILLWTERSLWTSIRRLGKFSDALVALGIHLAVVLGIVIAYLILGAQAGVPGSNMAGYVAYGHAVVNGVRLGATYMGFVVLAKVLWMLIPEILALRPSTALLDRQPEHHRVDSQDVGSLGGDRHLPGDPGLHPLVPPCSATGRAGADLRRHAVAALHALADGDGHGARPLEPAAGHPGADDLHGRQQAGPPARIDLGPDDRLHDDRHRPGAGLRPGQPDLSEPEHRRGDRPDRGRRRGGPQDRPRPGEVPRRPGRAASDPDVGQGAGQGVADVHRLEGNPQIKGIDVGQELEYRSHIEGGTPSAAIWHYGVVPDPYDPKLLLDRRIPVDSLLVPGTIEEIENRAMELDYRAAGLERRQKEPTLPAAEGARLLAEINATKADTQKLRDQSRKLQDQADALIAKAKQADAEKKLDQSEQFRQEAAELHSPPIPIEMTFTIYRTTKGRVGDPVYAELEVENPRTNVPKFRDTFPIREYYTNKRLLPASFLVGSLGQINVTIHCMSPTQYLGMAESDFYLLADAGNFGQNFMKGLFGIWLQAMVLTAIGVFAGTFLSWPVALLFTIAFFVAGHAATALLKDFVLQSLIGGGPFESLIRLISHDNQVNDLAPTLGVVVAKTFDSILMPVMARMVYLIPNLSSLDVSNTVAEGFAVSGPLMMSNTMIALAYAVPFSIAGYFILKNREVAA